MVQGKAKLPGQLHSHRCHQVILNSHPKIQKVLEYQQTPLETPGDQARQLDTSRDPWTLMETTEDQQTPMKTKGDP